MPLTGFHSTMDSPEWVSRVTPPRTTMTKTMAQQVSSQKAIRRLWSLVEVSALMWFPSIYRPLLLVV